MKPYARDLGDEGPPFEWNPERRERMRAELDGAYFRLYSAECDDVGCVIDAFNFVRGKDEAAHGGYGTERLILRCYDAMSDASTTGAPYRIPLNPPPGHGPRHPSL